ncbi:14094_t:CDS:2 [Funneliformis caledonium]|uniref:14094_t:CDS:1 n=1 Tax=Funneliformis caledonium TaxID=1117310 RepID=A0A9N9D8R9_9GLOM|nr:14094_t:CDS:2 [Funneliformis caledonium]
MEDEVEVGWIDDQIENDAEHGSYNGSGDDSDGGSYNSSGSNFDGDFSVLSNSYDDNLDHDFNSDFNKTDIFIRYTMAIENKLKIEDKHLTSGHKLRLKAIQYYLQLLNKGHAKSWSKVFINYNDVPKINHGKQFKGSSIIDDENVQLKVTVYLRQHKFDIIVNNFCDYVTNEILPSIGIEKKAKISQYAKGMYINSHERNDVIAYRKEFLKTMVGYQKLMPKFIEDELEVKIDPELEDGQYIHILVIHDETTFQSNDEKKSG